MQKERLKSVMALHGDNYKTLADYLGISQNSLCCKINESKTEFKQGEISKIRARYSLSDNEVIAIFFAKQPS